MAKTVYNLLHAEDNAEHFESSKRAIKEYFSDKEFSIDVTRARDGDEVYRHLIDSDRKIDILLLDFEMGERGNGAQVAEAIAKKYPSLPIFIISAYTGVPDIEEKFHNLLTRKIIRGYSNFMPFEKWLNDIHLLVTEKEVSLLHLSDIHFGDFFAFRDSKPDAEILLNLVNKIAPIDLIVLSGDISSRCEKKDYAAAYDFLKSFAEIARVEPENFIIVPGNHDFDRAKAQNKEYKKCFNNYIYFINLFQTGGEKEIFKYFPNESNLNSFYFNSMDDYKKDIADQIFTISVFDELKTLVIGLNSVNTDAEKYKCGVISKAQLLNMQNVLDTLPEHYLDYFIIATFHHNIFEVPSLFNGSSNPEKGKEEWRPSLNNQGMVLRTLFRNKARIILHGHSHYASAHKYLPYYVGDAKEVNNSVGYIISSGTFSGERANPLQFYFSVNHIKYKINLRNEVTKGVLTNYVLKLDDNQWKEAKSIDLEF